MCLSSPDGKKVSLLFDCFPGYFGWEKIHLNFCLRAGKGFLEEEKVNCGNMWMIFVQFKGDLKIKRVKGVAKLFFYSKFIQKLKVRVFKRF